MAIILEASNSQEVQGKPGETTPDSAILRFHLFDCFTEAEAHLLVEAEVPAYFRRLPIQDYRLMPKGAGAYDAEVNYAKKEPRKAGTITLNFDTGEQTVKLTHSLKSTYYGKPDEPIIGADGRQELDGNGNPRFRKFPKKDFHNAINVRTKNGKHTIEGTEIRTGNYAFTVTRVFGADETKFRDKILGALESTAWHINRDDMVGVQIQGILHNWPAGCLLFQGATGSIGGDGQPEIQGKFGFSPGFADRTIAGIPEVSKRGWDYLWVVWEEELDPESQSLTPKPYQVCVEQVYEEADLMVLFT